MASSEKPVWDVCLADSCQAVRLPNADRCWKHADDQEIDTALKRLGQDGHLDARGVTITAELLERILAATPTSAEDRLELKNVSLDQATFETGVGFDNVTFEGDAGFTGADFRGEAGFRGATFQGEPRFDRATFQSEAWFDGVTFQGGAGFRGAIFRGDAWFGGAMFRGELWLDEATFQSEAGFSRAVFEGDAWLDEATFQSEAGFSGAVFEGDAWFGGATFLDETRFGGATFRGVAGFEGAKFGRKAAFAWASFHGRAGFSRAIFQGDAGFDGVIFQGDAGFDGVIFQGDAGFRGVIFERARQIGPLLARQLILDDAAFVERVQLEVVATSLCARRAQFQGGMHLRLRFASVTLDDANLTAPAILAGVPSPFRMIATQEEQVARAWERLPPGPRIQRWRPRLMSVCRADVAGLRLADVDLRACRFAGAHNLDRLRIEGAPLFARTSRWWRARRKALAEEQLWRVYYHGRWRRTGWYPRPCQSPRSPDAEAPVTLEPARLAALYRELRKGREDAKDGPGAADFYYGECEMRRHDPGAPRAERLVLWAYWLLSGYALRAWRALAALAVVVVVAGVALAYWGFPSTASSFRPAAVDRGGALIYEQQPAEPPPGIGRLPGAVRFSARSATALLRGPDRVLTPLGEWLEIGLRFVGPILLGLAVVSVRGRLRR